MIFFFSPSFGCWRLILLYSSLHHLQPPLATLNWTPQTLPIPLTRIVLSLRGAPGHRWNSTANTRRHQPITGGGGNHRGVEPPGEQGHRPLGRRHRFSPRPLSFAGHSASAASGAACTPFFSSPACRTLRAHAHLLFYIWTGGGCPDPLQCCSRLVSICLIKGGIHLRVILVFISFSPTLSFPILMRPSPPG